MLTQALGGKVSPTTQREYGHADIDIIDRESPLFKAAISNQKSEIAVWMSHGDRTDQLPPGFRVIARSANSPVAAMANDERKMYAIQFHPEVRHTPQGTQINHNFVYDIAQCKPTWTPASFIEESIAQIRARVGADQVVCGLSGGVDSSVTAALLHQAIGDQLTCLFIDTGMLRHGEPEQVVETFQRTLSNLYSSCQRMRPDALYKYLIFFPITLRQIVERLKNLSGVPGLSKIFQGIFCILGNIMQHSNDPPIFSLHP